MVKNIHQAGKSVVLFGSCIPEQYESCIERRYLSAIHYLTLVCTPEELERRLRERPQWRNSGKSDTIKRMLDYNKWLIDNSSNTEPPMTILDTTRITVEQSVKTIDEWIRTRLS